MNEVNLEKILVVDDDPLNLKLACDLLEVNGFDVQKASTGEEALEALGESVPDLVLLDIQMPGMDGYETFRRIREELGLASLKVIALTALAMETDKEKIKNAGFDGHITKPIDMKGFVSDVRKIIEG